MSLKRRKFSPELKARVALEALSGDQTLSEVASRYGVHPTQITTWKKQAKEGIVDSFSGRRKRDTQDKDAQVKELHAKIGQLTVENDFFGQSLRQDMSLERRREMVDKSHPKLSIRRQCQVLDLGRSTYYYRPQGESEFNLELMRKIDELYLECPFYGSRQMRDSLRDLDYEVGRKRVQRLMRKMGLMAVYQKPRTSKPHPDHRVYPDLLRNLKIDRPDQVWCDDITYLPMRRGYVYLVAVMDWHSRTVLSWRLSNTMGADFCVNALTGAFARYGVPEIFNTDQGSQFTSRKFTQALKDAGAKISMDGRGRWLDNVMIERLWRSLKYECVYLSEIETVKELRRSLTWWFDFYNTRRPHSSLDGGKPMGIHRESLTPVGAPPWRANGRRREL